MVVRAREPAPGPRSPAPGSPGAVHYALPREFHPAVAAAAAAAPPGGDAPGDWAEKMESLLQNLEK